MRAEVLEHADAQYVGRQFHDDEQRNDERAAPAYLPEHFAVRNTRLHTLTDGELNAEHHHGKDARRNDDEGDLPLPAHGIADAHDDNAREHEPPWPACMQNVEPLRLVVLVHVGDERIDDRFHSARAERRRAMLAQYNIAKARGED